MKMPNFLKFIFVFTIVLFGIALFLVNTSKAWDDSILEHWNYDDTGYTGEVLGISQDDYYGKQFDEMFTDGYALKSGYNSFDNSFPNQFTFDDGLSINYWFYFPSDSAYIPSITNYIGDLDGGLFSFNFQPLLSRYTFRSMTFENNFSYLNPLTANLNSFPSDLIEEDTWYMFTIVLTDSKLLIYIDNVLYGDWSFSDTLDFTVINDMNFWPRTTNGYSLEDEKTIFDRSLDTDDISWLYNLGRPLETNDVIGSSTPQYVYDYSNALSFPIVDAAVDSSIKIDYYFNGTIFPLLTNEIQILDFDLAPENWLVSTSTVVDYNDPLMSKQDDVSYFIYTTPENQSYGTKYLYAQYNANGIDYLIPIKIEYKQENSFGQSDIAYIFQNPTSTVDITTGFNSYEMACTAEEWASTDTWLGINFQYQLCKIKKFGIDIALTPLDMVKNKLSNIKNSIMNMFPFNISANFLKAWNNAEISKLINPFYIPVAYAENFNLSETLPVPANGEGFNFKVDNFSGDKSLNFKIFNKDDFVNLLGENILSIIRTLLGFGLTLLTFMYIFNRFQKLKF